jgi:uncharacterized protein
MARRKRRTETNRDSFAAHLSSLAKAAEGGDLDAQHELAAFYATDDSLGMKDAAKAVEVYTRAAECGHAESQYDLGFMLLLGEGTKQDVAQGLWWTEQAVANGYAYAAKLLSDVYSRGLFGLEPDDGQAAFWGERAKALETEE